MIFGCLHGGLTPQLIDEPMVTFETKPNTVNSWVPSGYVKHSY